MKKLRCRRCTTLNSRFSHTTSEGSGAGPTLRACRFLPASCHRGVENGMRWFAGKGTAGQGRAGPDRAEQDLPGQGTFRLAGPCPEDQDRAIARKKSGQKDGHKYRKKQGISPSITHFVTTSTHMRMPRINITELCIATGSSVAEAKKIHQERSSELLYLKRRSLR